MLRRCTNSVRLTNCSCFSRHIQKSCERLEGAKLRSQYTDLRLLAMPCVHEFKWGLTRVSLIQLHVMRTATAPRNQVLLKKPHLHDRPDALRRVFFRMIAVKASAHHDDVVVDVDLGLECGCQCRRHDNHICETPSLTLESE